MDGHEEWKHGYECGRQIVLSNQVKKLEAEVKRLLLRWTTDKPTEDGWYWYRVEEADVRPVCIEVRNGIAYCDGDCWSVVYDTCVLWAGPIPEPGKEVKDAVQSEEGREEVGEGEHPDG